MMRDHAYLIKGYVVGHYPPQDVLDAVEALIAHFSTSEPVEESRSPVEAPPEPPPQPIEKEQAPAPTKTRAPWSEERKAKQAEVMRATQARLKESKASTPGEAPAPSQGGA